MARYLSPEWFDQVAQRAIAQAAGDVDDPHNDRLVLRQVVIDTPGGDVEYHVVVAAGTARIFPPGCDPGRVDLTITTDWGTASAIAQGTLAAQAALIAGKLRVKGNLATVSRHAASLAGLDPVPATVRSQTTY